MPSGLAQLIGLSRTDQLIVPAVALEFNGVDLDDYASLASSAKQLDLDIRTAYADALARIELEERVDDRSFLERAREFVELNEQVDTSATLLTELATFLGTFQSDLSAVSGHISELQGRSKTIEGRLASRRAVERSLHPLLVSIGISPALIDTVMDTEVGPAWVPAVLELDAKLGAIRSGPRVESRKLLDGAAEALRLRASQKILTHFLNLLKPFALSIAPSLPALQELALIPLKPLFDFLRRHSARQAHEFQKAYVSTIRWFYETGFRRYVRSLEKVRLRTTERAEDIGVVNTGSESSLALLSKRTDPVEKKTPDVVLNYAAIEGPDIVSASMTNDKEIRFTPEALFRSCLLVLMDNAESEYEFVTAFFGNHSSLPLLPQRASPPTLFSTLSSSNLSSPAFRSLELDALSSVDGSEWGNPRNSIDGEVRVDPRGIKLKKSIVDGIWKSIMEPAQEYSRNFVGALLDATPPSPVALLAMIRLNDAIIESLVQEARCPPMEGTLMGIRLRLWPVFKNAMSAQADSLKKVNGSVSSGVFSRSGVKDSAVQIIALRYVALFNSVVALSNGETEDELVFSSILRLRQELDKLLTYQASKMSDPAKGKAFLLMYYEELLQGLSAGSASSHSRSQTEAAYWRELLRKLGN